MFRKIRSNRDPRDTLYSELRKEFKVYADKGSRLARHVVRTYPRFMFGAMIVLLAVSSVLAVVLHRPAPKVRRQAKPSAAVSDPGFDHILAAGAALQQTIRLRRQVDSITAKKMLTRADSMTLIRCLDSLQHIHFNYPISP